MGLALVAANRIFLAGELAFGDQSRADLLAVAATMGLILDGLSQVDVETRESEVVQLRGERGRGVSSSLADGDASAARWAASTVLGPVIGRLMGLRVSEDVFAHVWNGPRASDRAGGGTRAAGAVTPQMVEELPDFSHMLPADYRRGYAQWRSGNARGAKGELSHKEASEVADVEPPAKLLLVQSKPKKVIALFFSGQHQYFESPNFKVRGPKYVIQSP